MNKMFQKEIFNRFLFLSTIVLFVLISLKWFYSQQKENAAVNWKGNLWADAGGYYAYLPTFFMYDMNPEKLLHGLNNDTSSLGELNVVGQSVSISKHRVFTKYYAGVAIMQAPVFLLVWLADSLDGDVGDGFHSPYDWVPAITVFILYFIAAFLLFQRLKLIVGKTIAALLVFISVLGTNVICYFTAFPGYSHAYSYFLVCALLYFSWKWKEDGRFAPFAALVIASVLIVAVRPVNVLILAVVFFDHRPMEIWKKWSWRHVLFIIVISLTFFLPQLFYYQYLTGSFFIYSYKDEGFSHLADPSIIEFLFSHRSGLFMYNPLWLLFIIATVVMIIKKNITAIIAILLFVFYVYLYSSWHIWSFGCSFGARNFVELTPLFVFVSALFYEKFLKSRKWMIAVVSLFIIFAVIWNFQLLRNYEKCYFGADHWDWPYFLNELLCKRLILF